MKPVRVDFGGVTVSVQGGSWRAQDALQDGGRAGSLERALNALSRILTPPEGHPDPDHWRAGEGARRLGGTVLDAARQQGRAGDVN